MTASPNKGIREFKLLGVYEREPPVRATRVRPGRHHRRAPRGCEQHMDPVVPFLIGAASAVVCGRLACQWTGEELKSARGQSGHYISLVAVALSLATVLTGHANPWVLAAAWLALIGGRRPAVPPLGHPVVQAAAGGGGLQAPLKARSAELVGDILCAMQRNMKRQARPAGAIAALRFSRPCWPAALRGSFSPGLRALAGYRRTGVATCASVPADSGAAMGVLLAAAARTTVSGWHGLLASGASSS